MIRDPLAIAAKGIHSLDLSARANYGTEIRKDSERRNVKERKIERASCEGHQLACLFLFFTHS